MRMCKRNKQPLWYATYVSKTASTDASSNKTGEWTKTYSTPVKVYANVQGLTAKADIEMYGVQSRNIIKVISEKSLPITETSVLWFEKDPDTSYVATSPKHNYAIDGIPTTLNQFVFYARKVDVT